MIALVIGCGQAQESRLPEEERVSAEEHQLDSTLVVLFDRMKGEADDLPEDFPETVEKKLVEVLRDPATFAYTFDSLRAHYHVTITESDDRRVRVFWWIHPHSGSYHVYPAVFQYRLPSGAHQVYRLHKDLDESDDTIDVDHFPSFAYKSIHHLRDSTYLTIWVGQLMGSMPFEGATTVTLKPGMVDSSDIVFEMDGSADQSLWFDKSWYLDHLEELDHSIPVVITYDSAARVITFPEFIDTTTGLRSEEIGGSKSNRPSGKTVRLVFDGRRFVEP